jgi:hypothetical protein
MWRNHVFINYETIHHCGALCRIGVIPLCGALHNGGGGARSVTPDGRVPVPGHHVPTVQGLHAFGAVASNAIMHLSIGLAVRHRPALDTLLQAQDNSMAPLFHHYLTAAQFAADFGPTPTTVKLVTDFFTSQDVHIDAVSSSHTLIFISAPVARVAHAFAMQFGSYTYEGRAVYAPTTEPSVPASLAGTIQSVVGLENILQLQHVPSHTTQPGSSHKPPQDPSGCLAQGYGPSDLRQAYNISPLVNTGFDGTGQNVAIVEFDGDDLADVNTYDTCYALPTLSPIEETVNVGPTPTTQGIAETDLDMEVVHAIAPGAQEIVYMAPNPLSVAVQTYDQVVNDTTYAPKIVSNSYDFGCESDVMSSDAQLIEQLDLVFAQANAEGMAFFTASGDYGAYDCNKGKSQGVGVPESDPHIVTVGGTTYTSGSPEVAWDDTRNQVSSGGGVSIVYSAPAYQQEIYSPTQITQREVPDVSADASNYAEYCSADIDSISCSSLFNSGGDWFTAEGTSASAPLWAGIAADINTYLLSQKDVTLGSANALLYQAYRWQTSYGQAINPVNSGCDYTSTYCTIPYTYNMVTGLGTPNAWGLAELLASKVNTNIESEVVWGTAQGGNVDLIAAADRSDAPGWQRTNVSQIIRSLTGERLSLTENVGQPAVVSYPTYGNGTEMDVFALATQNGTSVLYGFAYLAGTNSWSDLGEIANGTTTPLPVLNPTVVVEDAPVAPETAIFGVTSAGHLMEYDVINASRESGGSPNPWQSQDLSSEFGITCDPGIVPAAVIYNTVPVVFADCGNKLVEFYDNLQHVWHVNTGIIGSNIPNASHAFPGHGISAMVVPGSPSSIEVDVANDHNGVNVLSEILYDGSAWHASSLPIVSGHTVDQVYAQTVVTTTSGPTPISQVIAVDPATTSCSSLPLAVQYLYQPQLSNPAWHGTVLPSTHGRGITGMTAINEQGGTVFTEAYTGGYTGTGTPGAAGGSGCTSAGQPIYENFSSMSSSTTQSWATPNGIDTGTVENAGVGPTGVQFAY